MVGSCECVKETLGLMKVGNFVTNCVALSFSRTVLGVMCCIL
jgi:uncharacterized protein YejL (UPF0352 family)